MSQSQLPIQPKTAVGTILKTLPNKRLRDIVEKRYGLRGASMTLDAIGKIYGITRERVRQIENSVLKHLTKPEAVSYLEPIYKEVISHIRGTGGVVEEKKFLHSVAEKSEHPHLQLLLALHKGVMQAPETDEFHTRWYSDKDALAVSEKVMKNAVQKLDAKKALLSHEQLANLVSDTYREATGQNPSIEAVHSYINTSKLIKENPYKEYGLCAWPTVQPKSIRDKAYAILSKEGKPMHFQTIATTIDKSGFRGKKHAHPQTVHNELIKDSNRFVLVGRGLYALKEWGYEPGTVKDVIQSILKKENSGMEKEAIVTAVLSRRFVKENTILLNLQNKTLFKKHANGTYFLA